MLVGIVIIQTQKVYFLFAHGSGNSRHSPRNKYVAEVLQKDGLATLLVDLLTPKEEESDIRAEKISYKIPGFVLNKFNINVLAKRRINYRLDFGKS